MNDLSGFQNEREFARYLNGKKVKMVNPAFENLLCALYEKLNPEDRIHTKIDCTKKKYDIIIIINGQMRRISIKKGICNSVHVEGISSFIHFLIESGVSKEIIMEYLKYHYADGTTNGSGEIRQSGEEYKRQNQGQIDRINCAINNPYIVKRAIHRFILQGKNSGVPIDALVYGTVDDFLWITKTDIEKVILSKMSMESTGIHFGPLFCQPMNRCLNRNPKYEKKRFCVQIKWYSIFDDIIESMNHHYNEKAFYYERS